MGGLACRRLLDQVADITDELLLLVVEAGVAGELLQGGRGFCEVAVTGAQV